MPSANAVVITTLKARELYNTEAWQSGRMRRSCPIGVPMGKTVDLLKYLAHRKMFYAYVLKSDLWNRHYYGHSKDLEGRLKRHNQGKVRSTKAYKPWNLIYFEKFQTKSQAYKREMFFKTIDGYNYLKSKGII